MKLPVQNRAASRYSTAKLPWHSAALYRTYRCTRIRLLFFSKRRGGNRRDGRLPERNRSLTRLELRYTSLGEEACLKLSEVLSEGSAVRYALANFLFPRAEESPKVDVLLSIECQTSPTFQCRRTLIILLSIP